VDLRRRADGSVVAYRFGEEERTEEDEEGLDAEDIGQLQN
jgi:hypothetical protein